MTAGDQFEIDLDDLIRETSRSNFTHVNFAWNAPINQQYNYLLHKNLLELKSMLSRKREGCKHCDSHEGRIVLDDNN